MNNNYVSTGEGDYVFGLVLFLIILVITVFAIYAFLISPFIEKRNYIKMEIERSAGKERIFWERELKKLYWGNIPIIGRIIYKKRKNRD